MRHASREAFDRFVSDRQAALQRRAFALTADWHAAQDLTQEALEATYRGWGRLQHSEAAYAYTVTCMVRIWSKSIRKAKLEAFAEPPDVAAGDFSPAADNRMDLQRLLRALPPGQRLIVTLRYVFDMPISQIADLVGCSEGTVKSQTSKGLTRIRELMGGKVDL